MLDNPISPTVDFDKPGVQHGHLRLPHSHDESAWGSITIPIAVIANGEGPTAILTGANHGDEYEGPVALMDLARRMTADEVSGRIIIVPMMNYPAFLAGKRTSPIDGGNMNRVFPGSPGGTVTEKIADYFQRTLLPEADWTFIPAAERSSSCPSRRRMNCPTRLSGLAAWRQWRRSMHPTA